MFGMLNLSLQSPVKAASVLASANYRSNLSGLPAETQNYSAYLDGASDRIQGLSLATTWLKVVDANAAFTIHFAVKLDALNSTISLTGTSTTFVWLVVDSGGDLQFSATNSGVTKGLEKWDTNLSTGTWYDIVITGTGASTRDLKCYVNKVEKTATTATPWDGTYDVAAQSGKFTFGTFLNIVDYDLRVDRLASWSSVLTSDEITEIYDNYPDLTADSGNYVSSSDLVTYYKIEEGSGTTMSDSSGNSNGDLSVVNATGNFWSSDTRI